MAVVRWKGKDIESAPIRIAVGFAAAFFGLCVGMVAVVAVFAIILVTFPLHIPLRLMGRRGFCFKDRDGTYNYAVDGDAFRRA